MSEDILDLNTRDIYDQLVAGNVTWDEFWDWQHEQERRAAEEAYHDGYKDGNQICRS